MMNEHDQPDGPLGQLDAAVLAQRQFRFEILVALRQAQAAVEAGDYHRAADHQAAIYATDPDLADSILCELDTGELPEPGSGAWEMEISEAMRQVVSFKHALGLYASGPAIQDQAIAQVNRHRADAHTAQISRGNEIEAADGESDQDELNSGIRSELVTTAEQELWEGDGWGGVQRCTDPSSVACVAAREAVESAEQTLTASNESPASARNHSVVRDAATREL